ncbi:DMT family transporter [Comamonas sp. NLF-1-9]|uniref:DMT family transporter n=1 Tax=Comamonas sp. NLF-1-9 TaxID=2853163 RepID=UPI001C44E0BB|nr:DMT family transporter [Comamonas sp. NLF-1-9]QXL83929.1 DMT family transporter [Comamonas sp. NLF-1-9]
MPAARKLHLDSLAVGLLLACCLYWGFQQTLSKATLVEVAPIYQAFWRFALGTLALLLWCRLRGISLAGPAQPRGVSRAGVQAGLLFAGEFVFLFLAFKYTTASRATLFLYCSPFWVALVLPWFVRSEGLNRLQWAGLVCAFFGVLLALGDGWRSDDAAHADAWIGDLLAVVAGLLWGLTTCMLRASPLQHARPEKQLLWQMGVTTLVLPPVSWLLGEHWQIDFSAFAWFSLLVQGLIGAFVSYLVWMWMLTRYPATRMSVFIFLTPVFTLLIGATWLGEPVTPTLLGALTLVAAGIVLVNRRGALAAPGQAEGAA